MLATLRVQTFAVLTVIVPVWLHQKEDPERKKTVYALLDDQSDACFIKDSILQQLNVTGPAVQLKLSTVQKGA